MTIKQQGGIFGRNPSFNDVEAATVNVDTTTDNAVIGQFSLWNSSQSSQPYLRMAHSLGTSIGSHTAITVNDMLGSVAFAGSTGTAFYDGASVEGKATQTYTGSNGGTKLLFKTTPNGSQTLTEQMVLDQGGDLTISNGNLVIGTSGKGIDFSATAGTGTSELFDDYEEGTWTPTYSTTGTDFTSVTYNSGSTEGTYTKIGNMVNVRVSIRTDAVTIGSASGTVKINGLPFTASSNKNAVGCYGGLFSGDNPRIARAVSDSIFLYYRTSGNTADTPLAPADLGTGTDNNDVIVSLCYQTS